MSDFWKSVLTMIVVLAICVGAKVLGDRQYEREREANRYARSDEYAAPFSPVEALDVIEGYVEDQKLTGYSYAEYREAINSLRYYVRTGTLK